MMKKYLAWKQSEPDCPSIACAVPSPSPFSETSLVPGLSYSASATLSALPLTTSLTSPVCSPPSFPTFNTYNPYSSLNSLSPHPLAAASSLSSALQRFGATLAQRSLAATAATTDGSIMENGSPMQISQPAINLIPPEPSVTVACSPDSASLFSGPSAFSVVSAQMAGLPTVVSSPPALLPTTTQGALTAALYPQLMCIPGLLDRLTPAILRSHLAATQGFKPIPNAEVRLDPNRFKERHPKEWTADDVVTWLMDMSKKRNIAFEDLNMTNFAAYAGNTLVSFTEADFLNNDPVYGSILYNEFREMIEARSKPVEERALEEIMKSMKEDEERRHQRNLAACLPSTSSCLHPQPGPSQSLTNAINAVNAVAAGFDPKMRMSSHSLASTLSAALSPSMGLGSGLSPQSPLLSQHLQPKLSPMMPSELIMKKYAQLTPQSAIGSVGNSNLDYDSDDSMLHGVNDKGGIRKNKDGKPRKRSQHSKGNKLWEFIRDALKDPITCPSVVRWEDPHEGVFRIVESEKLARLWGERKNNQKMTYEKLSRAMRTYYEKQILVPVPKTGLYPKKLVYKFGPGASGWKNCRALIGITSHN